MYIHKNVANLDFDSVVNNDLHSGSLEDNIEHVCD